MEVNGQVVVSSVTTTVVKSVFCGGTEVVAGAELDGRVVNELKELNGMPTEVVCTTEVEEPAALLAGEVSGTELGAALDPTDEDATELEATEEAAGLEAGVVVGLLGFPVVVLSTWVEVALVAESLVVVDDRTDVLDGGEQSNPMLWMPISHPDFPVPLPGF